MLTPEQLLTIARTMTTAQLDAAMRRLIAADLALAREIVADALAECPISASNPPRRMQAPP
jgi:hypothetical protein